MRERLMQMRAYPASTDLFLHSSVDISVEAAIMWGLKRWRNQMCYLLAATTRTGDQIHIVYHCEQNGHDSRTSCGCKVASIVGMRRRGNNKIVKMKRRPNLFCEKCFHEKLPMENVKNLLIE